MGYAHADIELANARRQDLGRLDTRAMAEVGGLTSRVPGRVRLHPRLGEVEKQEVTVVAGRLGLV